MKLFLHCLFLLALLATRSIAQPLGGEYVYTTNLYLVSTWSNPSLTNAASLTEGYWKWPWRTELEFNALEFGMYTTNGILISGGIGSASGRVNIESGGQGITLTPQLGGAVSVVGDLNVSGTINYAGAIVWNTNNVMVTNATWANNVWYPTNAQTATVNMGIPYADYDTTTAPSLSVDMATVSTTNYQTAVVFVRQNPASTNVLGINIPAMASRQGTFNLTNVTVLTWFYNPHVPFTNVVALPLY